MHRVPGRVGLSPLDDGKHVQGDASLGSKRFEALAALMAELADRLAEGDLGERGLLARFQSRLGILLTLRFKHKWGRVLATPAPWRPAQLEPGRTQRER